MRETLDEEEQSAKLLHEQLTSKMVRLEIQEENLLDLAADGEMTSAKVKQRLGAIKRQQDQISGRLEHTQDRLAFGAALIENALVLLENPQDIYGRMGAEQRRLLNHAIFEKLYLFEDKVGEAVFNPPFDELMQVRDSFVQSTHPGNHGRTAKSARPSKGNHSDPLVTALFGDGSTKRVMVEVMGFEPTASTLRMYASRGSDQDLLQGLPGRDSLFASPTLTHPPFPAR
jgi:site-specific DNA recombinase